MNSAKWPVIGQAMCADAPRLWPYPDGCECDQDFATYCANSLRLKKTGKGATAPDGLPKGHKIAEEFCPGLKSSTGANGGH